MNIEEDAFPVPTPNFTTDMTVMRAHFVAYVLACFGMLTLSACGTSPPLRTMDPVATLPSSITISADGRMAKTNLSVLTYNIEGLGWPARKGRGKKLEEIGRRLALREAGRGPDIILFQEMFSGAAKKAVDATGYPAIVTGPRRTTRALEWSGPAERLPGKASIRRGEVGIRLTGGGLAIASRFPIAQIEVGAFGRRSCAGLDCLGNKGIMLARIMIPGVPVPIDIYNTHMNSTASSRVSPARHLAAHRQQARHVAEFIDQTHESTMPVILGGDFNMRHSEKRWESFTRNQSLKLVHQVCADENSGCEVKMSWDGDEPWMDTQDLQFYWGGQPVQIRPVRVEAMFDGGAGGPQLSDHDGFLVTYELAWPISRTGAANVLGEGGR